MLSNDDFDILVDVEKLRGAMSATSLPHVCGVIIGQHFHGPVHPMESRSVSSMRLRSYSSESARDGSISYLVSRGCMDIIDLKPDGTYVVIRSIPTECSCGVECLDCEEDPYAAQL